MAFHQLLPATSYLKAFDMLDMADQSSAQQAADRYVRRKLYAWGSMFPLWSNGSPPPDVAHIAELWGSAEYLMMSVGRNNPLADASEQESRLRELAENTVKDILAAGFVQDAYGGQIYDDSSAPRKSGINVEVSR